MRPNALSLSLLGALALACAMTWNSCATSARAGEPIRTDGSDLGITIMGAIVQKQSEDNVALIKDVNGSVKAVKRDHVILEKYKVLDVQAQFIEILTKDGKRYWVYQDKFAAAMAAGKRPDPVPGPSLGGVPAEYREEGFERVKAKISMTGMYRDKLVKEDLARVLMQATAEPWMENGQIVGFKLSQIDEGSIYSKAGLTDGDLITGLNGEELSSVAGSIKLLQSLKGADHLEVDVRRGDQTLKITVDVH
jgi:general secretion pathway protein C